MYKIGIIGLSLGNGHPYSWAAIFNGYNRKKMSKCPFPIIPKYLNEQKTEDIGIPEAKITHIWTQNKKLSKDIAESSLIENVVDRSEDIIGKVDAVILARDDGEKHLSMSKPFIEADIPILIDKPLTDNLKDLRIFEKYYNSRKLIMSCSSMRYVNELKYVNLYVGNILTSHAITSKYWRTYGIHLIEAIGVVMGLGVKSVQNIGVEGKEIVHLEYTDGRHVVLQCFENIHSSMQLAFYGDKATTEIPKINYFLSFKNMLLDFVNVIKTKRLPFDYHQTLQIIKILVASQISRIKNNQVIYLNKLKV